MDVSCIGSSQRGQARTVADGKGRVSLSEGRRGIYAIPEIWVHREEQKSLLTLTHWHSVLLPGV
ncbi:hypothetical protein BgiMline_011769, partial [Biomphalaria glabrata]